MSEKMEQGREILESIENPNEKISELLNMVRFICRSTQTGVRAKQWFLMKCRVLVEDDKAKIEKIVDDMEQLLLDERDNAEKTIPLVQQDSRLGWEPSMLYITDEWHLRWKIRQVDYVLNSEIQQYRKALKL